MASLCDLGPRFLIIFVVFSVDCLMCCYVDVFIIHVCFSMFMFYVLVRPGAPSFLLTSTINCYYTFISLCLLYVFVYISCLLILCDLGARHERSPLQNTADFDFDVERQESLRRVADSYSKAEITVRDVSQAPLSFTGAPSNLQPKCHTYIYIYIHTYTYTNKSIYIYIYIFIHTHIHI